MKKLVSLCTFVVLQVECQKGLTSSVISYSLLTKLYNKTVEQTSNIDHVYVLLLPMGTSLYAIHLIRYVLYETGFVARFKRLVIWWVTFVCLYWISEQEQWSFQNYKKFEEHCFHQITIFLFENFKLPCLISRWQPRHFKLSWLIIPIKVTKSNLWNFYRLSFEWIL
jgi:hypothetical protein